MPRENVCFWIPFFKPVYEKKLGNRRVDEDECNKKILSTLRLLRVSK